MKVGSAAAAIAALARAVDVNLMVICYRAMNMSSL